MNNKLLEIFIIIMGFAIMGLVTAEIYKNYEHGRCIETAINCGMSAEEVLKVCH